MMMELWMLLTAALLTGESVAAKQCDKQAPGLNRMAQGIDITKLDMWAIDQDQPDGFKNPVIDFTCNKNQKWTSSSGSYSKPDQVNTIYNVPKGSADSYVEIFKTSNEVERSLAAEVSVDYAGGMFAASSSYSKVWSTLTKKSKYIETVKSYVSSFEVRLVPTRHLKLDRYAKEEIDRLPDSFRKGPQQYINFINSYGTHFWARSKMGGLIQMYLATDESYFLSKSDDQVKAQANGMFRSITGAGSASYGVRTASSEFRSKTTQSVKYHGGDANLLGAGRGLAGWQPTVAGNPWIYGGKLSPLWELIRNGRKKQAMKQAVQVHLDKAALRSLLQRIRAIRMYQTNPPYAQAVGKCRQMLTQAVPNHAAVMQLSRTQIQPAMSAQKKWTQMPGNLKQVSIGDGKIIGVNRGQQIYYKLVSESPHASWRRMDGGINYISVGDGKIIGCNSRSNIYFRNGVTRHRPFGSGWRQLDGGLRQVSIGDGIIIGTNNNYQIYCRLGVSSRRPAGTSWRGLSGKLRHVAVGNGLIMGTSSNNQIYLATGVSASNPCGTGWRRLKDGNLKQVSLGDGRVIGVAGDQGIYARKQAHYGYVGKGWLRLTGGFAQVAVGDGKIVGANSGSQVYITDIN